MMNVPTEYNREDTNHLSNGMLVAMGYGPPAGDVHNICPFDYSGVLTNGAAWAINEVSQTWGILLDGTNDYISIEDGSGVAPFNQSDTNWTARLQFVYLGTGAAGDSVLLAFEDGSGTGQVILSINEAGSSQLSSAPDGTPVTGTNTLSTGNEYVAVIKKNGTTFKVYLDGTQEASFTATATANTGAALRVGTDKTGTTASSNINIVSLNTWNYYVADSAMWEVCQRDWRYPWPDPNILKGALGRLVAAEVVQ